MVRGRAVLFSGARKRRLARSGHFFEKVSGAPPETATCGFYSLGMTQCTVDVEVVDQELAERTFGFCPKPGQFRACLPGRHGTVIEESGLRMTLMHAAVLATKEYLADALNTLMERELEAGAVRHSRGEEGDPRFAARCCEAARVRIREADPGPAASEAIRAAHRRIAARLLGRFAVPLVRAEIAAEEFGAADEVRALYSHNDVPFEWGDLGRAVERDCLERERAEAHRKEQTAREAARRQLPVDNLRERLACDGFIISNATTRAVAPRGLAFMLGDRDVMPVSFGGLPMSECEVSPGIWFRREPTRLITEGDLDDGKIPRVLHVALTDPWALHDLGYDLLAAIKAASGHQPRAISGDEGSDLTAPITWFACERIQRLLENRVWPFTSWPHWDGSGFRRAVAVAAGHFFGWGVSAKVGVHRVHAWAQAVFAEHCPGKATPDWLQTDRLIAKVFALVYSGGAQVAWGGMIEQPSKAWSDRWFAKRPELDHELRERVTKIAGNREHIIGREIADALSDEHDVDAPPFRQRLAGVLGFLGFEKKQRTQPDGTRPQTWVRGANEGGAA